MMKCPVDNTILIMTERAGVEIDYCPECRGIWLDRGELDKIVARAAEDRPPQHFQESERSHGQYDRDDHNYHEQDRHNQEHDGKKKRGSFIGDIFGGFGDG